VTSNPDSSSSPPKPTYTVHLDTNETIDVSFEYLINPHDEKSPEQHSSNLFSGIPEFLSNNAKVTNEHNETYHKGFLTHSPEFGFQFVVKRNLRSSKGDFSSPLPDFQQSWPTLIGGNILFPRHTTISSFLHPNSSNNALPANFVSAKNLLNPCPRSLQKALHPSYPDHDIWLQSYFEEKGG
jgi:hypothetical protein